MKGYSRIAAAVLAVGLATAASGGALAAAEGGHESHGNNIQEMTLNDGQKWQTDDALRTGMSGIRAVLAEALPRVHRGDFTAAEYTALAEEVEQNVDHIVTNCKLPEQADVQLHIALTEIFGGIDVMKEDTGQQQGVVAVIRALDAYGDHFDHPGWQPLPH